MLDTGQGSGVIIPAESEAQVAADGRYVVLTVLAGLTFGLLAWRQRGNRGPAMLPVLAASSLLSSLLALATGQLLSNGQRSAPLDTAFHPPLVLHAGAAIFLQALLAVLVYTVFVGLSGDQELGRTSARPAGQPKQQPDPA
jgi:CHASE2 domain-containing sensor protein